MTSKPFLLTQAQDLPGKPSLPIFSVWGWELRRVAAKPLNWGLGLSTFGFFAAMIWFKHAWALGTESGIPFVLYGTSAIGLLYEFSVVLMLVFAFILPFVVTEGVARDYKQRIHEVLMATPLSTAAYVWGRFLAVLTLALGQAVLMLAAAWSMGLALHARNALYPIPAWSNLLTAWGVIVIPATLLIAGLGFSLGTLWPRRTRMIMLGLLIAWVLFFTVGDVLRLNPTGVSILGTLIPRLVQTSNTHLAAVPAEKQAAWLAQLEATPPDVSAWWLPQYSQAAVGMLCVVVAAIMFRRYRKELD
jgi:ABC-type transport system involved in multi-copper enzyme maturation permease subunit